MSPTAEMPEGRLYNILFLCTGNSARSILAAVLIDHWGKSRFNGYSAGSFSKGAVHRRALEELERHDLPTAGCAAKLARIHHDRRAGHGFRHYGL